MPIYHYAIKQWVVNLQEFDGVAAPSPFSRFLAEQLTGTHQSALDLGCGGGLQSIVLALHKTRFVLGVDIFSPCVEATLRNAELNRCTSQISAIQSNLFDSVPQQQFETIVSNPPTLPATDSVPEFCRAPDDGRGFVNALLEHAPRFLVRGGLLQMVHSSLADLPCTLQMLESRGFEPEVTCSIWLPFREFYMPHLEFFQDRHIQGKAYFRTIDGQCFEEVCMIKARLKS
jgi:methylase of polypeptide subunit release factors